MNSHASKRQEEKMNKKVTSCSKCARQFWYIDPRPGGRPRQKCGICSSRPPRYPWGFIDPNHPTKNFQDKVFIPAVGADQSGAPMPAYDNSKSNTDEAHAFEAYPMPLGEISNGTNESAKSYEGPSQATLEQINQRLDDITVRLERLEEQVEAIKDQTVKRSDWVDLSARLDIVEQNTATTLHKVHHRLEGFGKEVRQIAVVPEQELQGLFDIVHMLRQYLHTDQNGNH